MTKKDFISIGLSLCSLIISIIILLWGNNLVSRIDTKIDVVNQKTDNAIREINNIRIVGKISSAPVTEKEVGSTNTEMQLNNINLDSMNIVLADFSEQIPQVKEWLTDPYSGYPALVIAIMKLMGNSRLKGNAVPLTIINAKNLRIHGRPTNQPFINISDINFDKLKMAIYLSWKEKNSGSTIQNFDEIVH